MAPYGVCWPFGQETALTWTAQMDMQYWQKNDCWTCLKLRWSFEVPISWKSLIDILQDTEEGDWKTANIGGIVFEISCFMEKFAGYYGPVEDRCHNGTEKLWMTV